MLDCRLRVRGLNIGEGRMGNNAVQSSWFFREARTDLDGPLHGVRVLEVASTWAGPRCAAMLADYGADVIKVEQTRFAGRRAPSAAFLGAGDAAHLFL